MRTWHQVTFCNTDVAQFLENREEQIVSGWTEMVWWREAHMINKCRRGRNWPDVMCTTQFLHADVSRSSWHNSRFPRSGVIPASTLWSCKLYSRFVFLQSSNMLTNACCSNNNFFKYKKVAYSSQGSHTGQLDFCNWLADDSTTGWCD